MHYSKEEKTMWLKDWRQSGKSAWAYAKENNLNPQTFVNWTKAESKALAPTAVFRSPNRRIDGEQLPFVMR